MLRVQQKQLETDIQLEELKMIVMEDFQNVTGIAYETQAVLRSFKEDHPMINIHLNRLSVMVNLSNSIHCDIASRGNSKLQPLKQSARQMIEKVIEKEKFDPIIEQKLRTYLKVNLANNPHLVKEPMRPIDSSVKNEFNSGVVQQVLNSMGVTDAEFSRINKGGKYRIKSYEEIENQNKMRFTRAQIKCYVNFYGGQIYDAFDIVLKCEEQYEWSEFHSLINIINYNIDKSAGRIAYEVFSRMKLNETTIKILYFIEQQINRPKIIKLFEQIIDYNKYKKQIHTTDGKLDFLDQSVILVLHSYVNEILQNKIK